jgi:hypothetical protein
MLRFTTFRYAILLATRRNKCAIVFVHDDTGTRIQAQRQYRYASGTSRGKIYLPAAARATPAGLSGTNLQDRGTFRDRDLPQV